MFFLYTFVVSFLRRIKVYENRDLSYASTIAVLLSKNRNEAVLDIGTGTGYIANILCQNKQSVIGLDVNRNTFKYGKRRAFHALVADAHYMPFQDNVFDATLLISCIEHLDNPLKCISEIMRISKKNSICITQLPNLQWPIEPHTKFPFLYFMPRLLQLTVKNRTGYASLNMSITVKKVILWFSNCGFQNIYRKHVYHSMRALRFLTFLPLGWFLVFQKTKENCQSQCSA